MAEHNDRRAFSKHPEFDNLAAAIETAERAGYSPPFARRIERLARTIGQTHNVDHEVVLRAAKVKVTGNPHANAALESGPPVRGGVRAHQRYEAKPEYHPGYPDGLPPYLPPMPRRRNR